MNKVATAINNKATNSTELMIALGNDFSYFKATTSATLPYGTFTPVVETPEKSFRSNRVENGLWQINVFTETATEAGELLEIIKNVFDDAQLSIENHDNLNCGRENARIREVKDEEIYHGYVEYRIFTEEN